MKCPKCQYLGFETGDRCKNCGYDFSLLVPEPSAPVSDLVLRPENGLQDDQSDGEWAEPEIELRPDVSEPRLGLSPIDRSEPSTAGHRMAPAVKPDADLPLFSSARPDDEPLVRAPSPQRQPAVVRPTSSAIAFVPPAHAAESTSGNECCEARPRAIAAVIDVAILSCIDVVVLYLTLRMAMLTLAEWRLLPLWPVIVFLALIRIGYFSAFAAIGGQTIGKMVAGIRVVTEDGEWLSPGRAIQRTLAAIVSFVTLGAAFAPALFGSRLALHDRVTRTRVVALSA